MTERLISEFELVPILIERDRLKATNAELLAALETIAGFAPGNGDVCEIIAKRARAAIATATEKPAM